MRRSDEAQLFEQHARRLHAVVSRQVRTSTANVEDACGFAWLQLVRVQPRQGTAFAWLCTTAIREAMKLHRRTSQIVGLEQVVDIAMDPRHGPDGWLELIAAGEEVRQPGLRPREARIVSLRAAGYNRQEMGELTGNSDRTVERQLGRAQRRLNEARRGSLP